MSAPTDAERIALAEELLGYRFTRKELLREALTHRSASTGRARLRGHGSNERLEFIGDRVLGLLIAEWLAERFPAEQEGQLGPRHAYLVSKDALVNVATEIGFTRCLSLGQSEALAGVGALANVLADAIEAALGAVYIDGGLEVARRFVRDAWGAAIDLQKLPPKDAKTALQEKLLARGQKLPSYDVVATAGPPHAPEFVVRVTAGGLSAEAKGGNKRLAERLAAAALLEKLS